MPVRRFRNVEEMNQAEWLTPGSAALSAVLRANWELAERTVRPRFPPGVYRHRSIEDAKRLRTAWEAENLARYRARLGL